MKQNQLFSFGIVTDTQYEDAAPQGDCDFHRSLQNLEGAVLSLNSQQADFVVQCGDLINQDTASYEPVLEILSKLKMPIHHVLGNHDFVVADSQKGKVPEILDLDSSYYSIQKQGFRLLFLDGNDLSLNAHIEGSEQYVRSQCYYEKLETKSSSWNGAIGSQQVTWLEEQLEESQKSGQKVLLFCHFPLLPQSRFSLWNNEEVLGLLGRYSCVKVWFNGHDHKGACVEKSGVHFVTLHGMIEAVDNAFSKVAVFDDRVELTGFGEQESLTLLF